MYIVLNKGNITMKKTIFSGLFALFAFVGSPIAEASYMPGTSGYSQFANMTPPQIDNNNLNIKSTMLCYSTFCSYESGLLRIPVYSAEHLTYEQVQSAKGASRKSLSFFPDPHIPSEYSAKMSDFSRTGYDRGHMAPWADSADPDCFTFANILPQNADNNRHLWEGIETTVRKMTEDYGEVYIVSGPIFTQNVSFLNDRVAIPDHLYKAVYIPAIGKTGVYVVKNAPGYEWHEISLDDLYALTHVNQFPNIPDKAKKSLINLPLPDVHGKKIPASQETNTYVDTENTTSDNKSMEEKHPILKKITHNFMKGLMKNL